MKTKMIKLWAVGVMAGMLWLVASGVEAQVLDTQTYQFTFQEYIYDAETEDNQIDTDTSEVCLRFEISNTKPGFPSAPLKFQQMTITNFTMLPIADGGVDIALVDERASGDDHGVFSNIFVSSQSRFITKETCFNVDDKDSYWNIILANPGLYVYKVRLHVIAGNSTVSYNFEFAGTVQLRAGAVPDDEDMPGDDIGDGDDGGDSDDGYGFSCKNKGNYGFACTGKHHKKFCEKKHKHDHTCKIKKQLKGKNFDDYYKKHSNKH